MSKLRIAIIGCNNMGGKHLSVLRDCFSREAEIAGILNSTRDSSERRAAELNVPFFSSLDEITPDKVDAAIVATPGKTHADIGVLLLSRGLPCLIEKPLATTTEDCDRLIAAAAKGKTVIIPGHTENYNPAVIRLKQELKAPIVRINGIRTSRNAANRTGISAVQELMIHDLAIVQSLLGNNLKSAKISKRPELSWENHAIAEMAYKGGAAVKLEALREDREVERYMDVEDADGNRFHIDFMGRSLFKNGKKLTEGGNSLQDELADFINCASGKSAPLVGAAEATDILKLCLRLEKEIGSRENLAAVIKQNLTRD